VPASSARNFLKPIHEHAGDVSLSRNPGERDFTQSLTLNRANAQLLRALGHQSAEFPRTTILGFIALFLLSFLLVPFIRSSFLPRTDAGQFVINLKAPTGTRIEITNDDVKKVEDIVRQVVEPKDLTTIVSNIGVMPDFSLSLRPTRACTRPSCSRPSDGPSHQQL